MLKSKTNHSVLKFLHAQRKLLEEIFIEQVYNLASILENLELKKPCLMSSDSAKIEKINIELNNINADVMDKKLEKWRESDEILSTINLISGIMALGSLIGILFAGPIFLLLTGFAISLFIFLVGITVYLSNQADIVMAQSGNQALKFRFEERDAKFNANLIVNFLKTYVDTQDKNKSRAILNSTLFIVRIFYSRLSKMKQIWGY